MSVRICVSSEHKHRRPLRRQRGHKRLRSRGAQDRTARLPSSVGVPAYAAKGMHRGDRARKCPYRTPRSSVRQDVPPRRPHHSGSRASRGVRRGWAGGLPGPPSCSPDAMRRKSMSHTESLGWAIRSSGNGAGGSGRLGTATRLAPAIRRHAGRDAEDDWGRCWRKRKSIPNSDAARGRNAMWGML